MRKYEKMPIGFVGTGLGLVTLSNGYDSIGLSLVRIIAMFIGMYIWFIGFRKITTSFHIVKEEYLSNTVTATLYATFSMLTMVLSSFIEQYFHFIGTTIWLIAVVIQMVLILLLFAKHILAKRNLEVILPSWYVTLLGLLVSTAIGANMNYSSLGFDFVILKQVIVIYGFFMYFCTIPFVVYRLAKKELPAPARYTKTILLAPISLIIVGYINVFTQAGKAVGNTPLVIFLYLILLITMIYVALQTKSFLKGGFTPGWASLTFPMAIAVIASFKASVYFETAGLFNFSTFAFQLYGVQLFITTGVIMFVLINYLSLKKDW